MRKEILKIIRDEALKGIDELDEYNRYAKRRNELAVFEDIKKRFGLPYTRNLELPYKTRESVIMDAYKKHQLKITEGETNGIYIYVGSYMPSDYSLDEIEEGFPMEVEVDYNDPRATVRTYWNLEGVFSKTIDVAECYEFEKNHTVILGYDFDMIQKEFVIAAVRENQEKALCRILTKYIH